MISFGLLSGLISSAWVALLNIALVPIYIKYLGSESWGLVGFYTTLQTLFLVFDIGLASTIGREVARGAGVKNDVELKRLFRFGSSIYWCISIAIFLIVLIAAPFLSQSWLKINTLSAEVVKTSLILIGFLIAVRWPISLYQSVLNSSKKMIQVSAVTVIMTTIAGFGYIFIVTNYSSSILAFFIWQAGIGLVQTLILRHLSWRSIGERSPLGFYFDSVLFKKHWHFTRDLAVIGITGLALSQIDKIFLSKLLPLHDFGNYMIGTTLMGAIYLIINPVYNFIYPYFTALATSENSTTFSKIYLERSQLFASILFPIVFFLVFFLDEILQLWIKNPVLAREVLPTARLLILGAGLHGIMYFPYVMSLATGFSKVALKINLVLIIVTLPTTYLLISNFGALGGAISWVLLQLFYIFFGTFVSHQQIPLGSSYSWLLKCFIMPTGCSLLMLPAHALIINLTSNTFTILFLGLVLMTIISTLLISSSKELRSFALDTFDKRRGT